MTKRRRSPDLRTALNGTQVDGSAPTVNEARPREDRGGGGGVADAFGSP
jgi:hypothetical protein